MGINMKTSAVHHVGYSSLEGPPIFCTIFEPYTDLRVTLVLCHFREKPAFEKYLRLRTIASSLIGIEEAKLWWEGTESDW